MRRQALAKALLAVVRNGVFATAVFTFIFAWNDASLVLVLTRTGVATYTVFMGQLGARSTICARIAAMSGRGTLPIPLAVASVGRCLARGIPPGAGQGMA
jgi:multiple sugar transport system permease protein